MMLSLEIVTPKGTALAETRLSEVVVRRREERFERGSEVALLPGHAPLLMQTSACRLRWRRPGARVQEYEVGPGLLEVRGDHVLLVVEDARTSDTRG